jgi:hypothetical protein
MGSNIVGSTKIAYQTKDKIPVEYIYYDLKGRGRFPSVPSNEKEGTTLATQSKTCSPRSYATSKSPLNNSKF